MHGYAKTVTACAFLLIAAGGLVTSTGSGLSVPDWPLSYGQLFPPMVGGVLYEHTHRVIAGVVGLMTLGLMIGLLKTEKRAWVRIFGVTTFLTVLLQAVLGGLTVIYLLPTVVSVFHACLAQTFLCLVGLTALFTSREWKEAPAIVSENAGSVQRLLMITTAFIFLQLLTGAIVRHTGGEAFTYHLILAFLILLHTLFIFSKISREKPIRTKLGSHAAALGFLTLVQISLGFGSYIMTFKVPHAETPGLAEIFFRTAHQANGALVLMACVLLTARSLKVLKHGTVS